MKTVQPRHSTDVNRRVFNGWWIAVSFFGWGLVFGLGLLLASRQLSKIVSQITPLDWFTAGVLGLVVFVAFCIGHVLRGKLSGVPTSYSVKSLALPYALIVVELAIAWFYGI